MTTKNRTLGAGNSHIYATRAATLQYQALTRGGFEAARRVLSEALLSARYAGRVRDTAAHWYTFDHPTEIRKECRALVSEEGGLLVVTSVSAVLRDPARAVYTGDPPFPGP